MVFILLMEFKTSADDEGVEEQAMAQLTLDPVSLACPKHEEKLTIQMANGRLIG
jgi:hypothetical protein